MSGGNQIHHAVLVDAGALSMSTHTALSNIGGTIEDASNGAAITISANGAAFIGEPSEQTVEMALRETAGLGRACQFIIGDLINHANGRWGEKYERWMETTGLSYDQLSRSASVCRSIPISERNPSISYGHYKILAPLPADDRKVWEEEIVTRGMSVKRTSKSVELGRVATQEDLKRLKHTPDFPNEEKTQSGTTSNRPSEPAPIETVHPWVNRLSAHLGKMENSGELDGLTPEQLFNLHRDLMPILTKHGRIINRLLRIAPDHLTKELRDDMMKALGR